jgi:hypothetical protein
VGAIDQQAGGLKSDHWAAGGFRSTLISIPVANEILMSDSTLAQDFYSEFQVMRSGQF